MDGFDRQGLSATDAARIGYTLRSDLEKCIRRSFGCLPMRGTECASPSDVDVPVDARRTSLSEIRRCLRGDHELIDDIMTEAIVSLARRANKVDEEGKHVPLLPDEVRPYLFGTVRRIAWNRGLDKVEELAARVRFGAEEADGEALAMPGVQPDQLLESKERYAVVRRSLTHEQRLLLDAWMKGRYQDAMRDLGISYGAARKRIATLHEQVYRVLGMKLPRADRESQC